MRLCRSSPDFGRQKNSELALLTSSVTNNPKLTDLPIPTFVVHLSPFSHFCACIGNPYDAPCLLTKLAFSFALRPQTIFSTLASKATSTAQAITHHTDQTITITAVSRALLLGRGGRE